MTHTWLWKTRHMSESTISYVTIIIINTANYTLKYVLTAIAGYLLQKPKIYSVHCRPQGTCEWQICRQQKDLHQYWNSQNRDSLRVPDATGSTDERGQRPALDNRSFSAINFATYSGPRHRDYSFGPNPKVVHWLMGNQYGRAEFSEVLWEERRLVWWCQRLG